MRAKNMQALTIDVRRRYPNVVVYGVGDDDHKTRLSDHNEDDTPGSMAAQSDADSIPEHRAIDVMVGSNFSMSDAQLLVDNLLSDPAARTRLVYLIFNGKIWSRKNNWVVRDYDGEDPHRNHVHISGWAPDDENDSPWPAVHKVISDPTPPQSRVLKKGDSGSDVRHVQTFLRNTFPVYRDYVTYKRGQLLVIDGEFGLQTEVWVKEFQRRTGLARDGVVGPKTLQMMRKYGYKY